MPHVVTCVVESHGKILILQRSDRVRTYKNQWGGVAGYIEPDEHPTQTAYKELREETGYLPDDLTLLLEGDPISFSDIYHNEKFDWTVHPFLFRLNQHHDPTIDWEHTDYRWVTPEELTAYDTVPHFTSTVQELWRKKRMGKRGGVVRKREEK